MIRQTFLFAVAFVALGLASCKPDQTATTSSTEQSQQSNDGKLEMAGVKSAAEMKEFLQKLQTSLAANDKAAVAAMLKYPFKIYKNGQEKKNYKSEKEFLKDFDKYFTADVKKAVSDATYETLFINAKGIMIGNGEVWMSGWDEKLNPGPVKIIAVQPAEITKNKKAKSK